MQSTVFLAGATGAIGSALAPLLVAAGFRVYGSSRRAERAAGLAAMGVIPVIIDVFDAAGLRRALEQIKPLCVIHQLTDLPPGLDPARMQQAIVDNARLREVGTTNLVAAALAGGCAALIAQSIAWVYRPGSEPYREEDPLDLAAQGPRGVSIAGIAALEAAVLGSKSLRGTVLRYGQIYGPGTGSELPAGACPVHVEAAAHAALLAVHSPGGIFNIAEACAMVSSAKAIRQLGWSAQLRSTNAPAQ